jgi:multiple sugar transport system permease protein
MKGANVQQVSVQQSQSGISRNQRELISTTVQYAVNFLLVFVFIFPIVFMLMSSFKNNDQIFSDLRSLNAFLPTGKLSLENYAAVFAHSQFLRFVSNSLGIAALQVILALTFNSMAAYSLSRLKWQGQQVVLAVIIATLIIPFETIAMPLLLLVSKLPNLSFVGGIHLTAGWLNTYQVQIIPFVAGAYSIFLFYQFFNDIPRELDESALIDGASRFQIYRYIIVPNAGPVFATVAILTFLGAWNSFLWPIMVVQSEELRPVMVGLQYFFQRKIIWGEVMAYTTMVTLPVLALFLAFQGAFVKSLASSGVKG